MIETGFSLLSGTSCVATAGTGLWAWAASPVWIFPLAVLILLLAGAKVAGRGAFQEEPFGLAQAKCLQGACAVMIILHHSSQELINHETGNAGALTLFYNAGVLLVGVFFFYSGYGLLKSTLTRPDYLKGFLRKRLMTVLVPFWVCTAIYLLVQGLLGSPEGPVGVVLSFCGIFFANPHQWYVIEISLLYLIFWAAFRWIANRRTALLVVALAAAGITLAGPLLGHGPFWFQGEWWYNTTLLFVVGMMVAMYEKQITAFLQKHFAALIVLLAAAFIVLYQAASYALDTWSYWDTAASAYRCLALQLPMVICFIMWMATLLQKVRFGNPALRFLGGIGLEIYLLHNLFLQNLHNPELVWVGNEFLYVLLILAGGILLAVPVHALDQAIVRRVAGKKPPKEAAKEATKTQA